MIYLAIEILLFLILAWAVGVLVGWLVWGRHATGVSKQPMQARRVAKSPDFSTEQQVELEHLRQEVSDIRNQRDEVYAKNQRFEVELESLRQSVGGSAEGEADMEEINFLRRQNEEYSYEIVSLRKQLDANLDLSSDDHTGNDMDEDDYPIISTFADEEDDADVHVIDDHEEYEISGEPPDLLSEPIGAQDNLKKISGVGPKLERLLNELGIYHFWQIAELSPDNIFWLDERLQFKGRIEREQWVQQATDLAAGRQTEFSLRYTD